MFEPKLELPPRPSIPFLSWTLVGVLLVSFLLLCYLPLKLDELQWKVLLVATGIYLLGNLLVMSKMKASAQKQAIKALLVGICIGLLAVELFVARSYRAASALENSNLSAWQFRVMGDCKQTQFGWRCRAQAYSSEGHSVEVWLSLHESVNYGEQLVVVGRYKPLNNDSWGYRSRLQGIWGEVTVRSIRKSIHPQGLWALPIMFRRRALSNFCPEKEASRAVLAGAVCGYRSSLDTQGLNELFSACGVAHLMAVSGGHIAIISHLLLHQARLLHLRPGSRAVLSLCVSALFVLSCGAPPSAIRSWIMSAVAALSWCVGRREHTLSAVSFVALLMAICNPGLVGQLGFQLSVLAVVGLCLFSAYVNYGLKTLFAFPKQCRLPRRLKSTLNELRSSCAASLVCQVVTIPLTLPLFSLISFVAPLANSMVMLPFTALVVCGALAASTMDIPLVNHVLLAICDVCANLVLTLLRLFASFPLACITVDLGNKVNELLFLVMIFALLVALYRLWPPIQKKTCIKAFLVVVLALFSFFVRWRYFAPARMVVLDVGQGDAILVQEGAQAVLIDTGPPDTLSVALARQNVFHLDALVLTHQHADHVGGVADLAYKMPCEQIFFAEGVTSELSSELESACKALVGTQLEELSYGDTLHVGQFVLRMIWPRMPVSGLENKDSIQFDVLYQDDKQRFRALLTGDAEKKELAELIAAGDIGDIDVLKLGHHGSKISLTAKQAQELLPELCLASAGEKNKYGHPSGECIEIVKNIGSCFLCTIDCGDICVCPAEGGPTIVCQKSFVD